MRLAEGKNMLQVLTIPGKGLPYLDSPRIFCIFSIYLFYSWAKGRLFIPGACFLHMSTVKVRIPCSPPWMLEIGLENALILKHVR